MAQQRILETVLKELQDTDGTPGDRKHLLIIEGVQENGKTFRPSDWSERLSSTFGQFGKDHRLHYDPNVYPRVFRGKRALAVSLSLQWMNPAVFKTVIKFARDNQLNISELLE